MMVSVLVAAALVMLVSLTGILFTHSAARELVEMNLSYLVSFSAGVFLVTSGGLVLEVLDLAGYWWQGVLYILVGYTAAWGLSSLLPETHHHHDASCTTQRRGAQRLMVGDAIHNVADGIVLVPAFFASPMLGVAATVSILIHETLQGISEYFVLRQAGFTARKALTINFVVSSTILIGVVIAYFALVTTELELILLAVSAGFFLHVVVHDLLPRPHGHDTPVMYLRHVAIVLCGILLMAMVGYFVTDSHGHEGQSHSVHGDARS